MITMFIRIDVVLAFACISSYLHYAYKSIYNYKHWWSEKNVSKNKINLI